MQQAWYNSAINARILKVNGAQSQVLTLLISISSGELVTN
jgi:hypothetical protein